RGTNLERSMSRYLIDQLASRPNIWTLFGTEIVAAHGEASLEAIEVTNGARGTRRYDSGGLFILIGADAETRWLPPEIALDARGCRSRPGRYRARRASSGTRRRRRASRRRPSAPACRERRS